MSNNHIKEHVETLEKDIRRARTSEQILAAINKVRAFRKPLVYDHSRHILVASLSILTALFIILGKYYHWSFIPMHSSQSADWILYFAIACLLFGALLISQVFKNRRQITNLAKLAYQKDALLDNNLTHKAPFNSEEMRIRFSELNRGNHARTFKQVITGEYQGEEHKFTFDYYHFHYVDKRTVTTTHGKRMRTKTVYDKYDRYGLIIPFGFYKNLQIFSLNLNRQYHHQASSGSIAFDKAFKVRASDELTAARFLKPAVVIAILDMSVFLTKMNIEIDATGLMCLSFNDRNMVMGNQRFDLSDPEAFYNELAGQTKLRLLNRTLRFVHQLLKHSDSNFKDLT